MSASPSLNPASTPFFPGGGGFIKEDDSRAIAAALHRHNSRDTFGATSISNPSLSPSEYRSVKSSPSPSQTDGAESRLDRQSEYHSPAELSRHSPANIVQLDAERGGFAVQRQVMRESSMTAILEDGPEGEETPGPLTVNGSYQHNTLYSSVMGRVRERLNTPPVNPEPNSRSSSFNSVHNNNHIMSSSPASSLDSGSIFSNNIDVNANFDAHLRVSPAFHEVLDRLDKHDRNLREIFHSLQDVTRKVDLLVERAFVQANSPPEFSNPFAGNTASSFSPPSMNGFSGPRGSIIGNIPPNQPAPADDISVISHRLSSLSTSVDQLLAIQQQSQNGAVLTQSPQPNDLMAGRGMIPQAAAMGLGIPGRTGPRLPAPPARTWSTGNLDIPMRLNEQLPGPLGRADPGLRDKRRSIAGLLRRDSTATIDTVSTTSTREGGPVISKWEQLPLHPDLLRSLTSFGVGPPNKIQQRALPFLLRGADIIAQAPPTQERIAAYVIPAIHIAVTHASLAPMSGPLVVMISTTVDQATQAHRMIRDLGFSTGVRSALGVGSTSGGNDLAQELRLLHQSMPHIICGTPQKLHALFTTPGGISGSEVRFLVLDEVDQLIARNLQDFVFNIVKLLPAPRTRPLNSTPTLPAVGSSPSMYSVLDGNSSTSSLNPSLNNQRRFSTVASSPPTDIPIERQTALFSNTVPQDVLNLATAINLREPVRVLVRRDGNVTQSESGQGGRGLRQFYLYLAFTAGGGRSDVSLPQGGTGIIGSGRGTITSAETVQAREWKLDALADLLDDIDVPHVIVHVGGQVALDNVSYKLASRGLDVIPLNNDMNTGAKIAALNKFRNGTTGLMRQPATRVLVVYDVVIKQGDVPQVPLVINYDLPKAVEEYAHRVNPAIATGYSRAGVVINFVTATGGDVEMLRSIECFYKIKCPEVPSSLRDIL